MSCECFSCTIDRNISKAIAEKNIDKLAELTRQVLNLWICAEDERDFYQSIVDGSWPNAEEILTRSLEKIKNNINKESNNGGKE
jgi:hypothetical protein